MLAVVALLTAWVAGRQAPAPDVGGTDAVRLGPRAGEPVSGYLARVRQVPPGHGPRLALVQFSEHLDAAAAASAVAGAGVTPLQAVFRVPLPRVQTALRRVDLISPDPAAALPAARSRAGVEAGRRARVADGRARAVARAEQAALAGGCACVLALVARLDRPAAGVLASRPAVRAVQVAPPGARPGALAVSPLLPEQAEGTVVGPVPDDGPVPG